MRSIAILMLALAAFRFGCPAESLEGSKPRRYQARLLETLRGDEKPGTRFSLRVVGSLQRERADDLPRNTIVRGKIRRSRAVGMGLLRERAYMELAFTGCESGAGEPLDCAAELVEVDNARETVRKPNLVQGIAAASHPHSLMSGVWLRPTPLLFGRSAVGLTGAVGKVQSRMPPNPVTLTAIAGVRTVFFRLPEPEILLPAGTDFVMRIAHGPVKADVLDAVVDIADDVREELRARPAEVRLLDRNLATDIVNFAFWGSGEEVKDAFRAAGWTEAEALTAKTFAKTYKAFASMQTYAAAPVSQLLYEGRAPDAVFQKSFNTLAKRHHIRLWKVDVQGQELWLGAATHDIGIAFDWGRMSITHRIDMRIDRERSAIVNDLTDAGCVASREWLERPDLRSSDPTGVGRISDGAMALVQLQPCSENVIVAVVKKKMRKGKALGRRIILETRQYITRGNPYYYAYWAMRWGVTKRRPVSVED